MTMQPEERAAQLLKEMDALIETCEGQIKEGAAFREANGLSEDALKRQIDDLPADKRAELQAAVDRDMREVEDEVAQAKLASDHAPRGGGAKRPKMRPMV